jgi:ABC-2 type transport system ATP-binding protein
MATVRNLDGVNQIRDLGQVQELQLRRGTDPQDVLRALMAQARVTSFSLMKPSLHDIFIRIAEPPDLEAKHANA